jgi:hypothetical protein
MMSPMDLFREWISICGTKATEWQIMDREAHMLHVRHIFVISHHIHQPFHRQSLVMLVTKHVL